MNHGKPRRKKGTMHDGNFLRALQWVGYLQICQGIVRRMVKRIESLGFKVTLEELPAA
jgi:hypothetical protein